MKSGQRIDGNQEFIGQGLSNIAGAFTSGVPVVRLVQPQRRQLRSRRAHAARVGVLASLAAGRDPASPCAPLGALPAARGDGRRCCSSWRGASSTSREIRRIARTSRGDLARARRDVRRRRSRPQLEFAIFVGVLASLLVYLNRTTHPSADARGARRAHAAAPLRAAGARVAHVPAARHPAPRRVALLRRRRARARRARSRARASARKRATSC